MVGQFHQHNPYYYLIMNTFGVCIAYMYPTGKILKLVFIFLDTLYKVNNTIINNISTMLENVKKNTSSFALNTKDYLFIYKNIQGSAERTLQMRN